MERICLGDIRAGGLKDCIRRNQNLGVLPQKIEQIFAVGRRDLPETDEIAVIVEIEIKDCNAKRQGHCDGHQQQRMFSQSLHAAVLPVRREMKSRSAAAVNGRFDGRGPVASA